MDTRVHTAERLVKEGFPREILERHPSLLLSPKGEPLDVAYKQPPKPGQHRSSDSIVTDRNDENLREGSLKSGLIDQKQLQPTAAIVALKLVHSKSKSAPTSVPPETLHKQRLREIAAKMEGRSNPNLVPGVPATDVTQKEIEELCSKIVSGHGIIKRWIRPSVKVRYNDHVIEQSIFRDRVLALPGGFDKRVADRIIKRIAVPQDPENYVSVTAFFRLIADGYNESVMKTKQVTIHSFEGLSSRVKVTPLDTKESILCSTSAKLSIKNPEDMEAVTGSGDPVQLDFDHVSDGDVFFLQPISRLVPQSCSSSPVLLPPSSLSSPPLVNKPMVERSTSPMDFAAKQCSIGVGGGEDTQGGSFESGSTGGRPEKPQEPQRAFLPVNPGNSPLSPSKFTKQFSETLMTAERTVTSPQPQPQLDCDNQLLSGAATSADIPSARNKLVDELACGLTSIHCTPFQYAITEKQLGYRHTSMAVGKRFSQIFRGKLREERQRRGLPLDDWDGEDPDVKPPPFLPPQPALSDRIVDYRISSSIPSSPSAPSALSERAWTPKTSDRTFNRTVHRRNPHSTFGARFSGVRVVEVLVDSPAAIGGLTAGMTVHAIDAMPVRSEEDIKERLGNDNLAVIFTVSR